jgi:hypothetical protein
MAEHLERRRFMMDAAAAALVLLLAGARVVLDATREWVFVLGHRLDLPCLVKQTFGIPCPACGITRSVVLSLHGRLGDALAVNPAGALFALGLVLLAVGLLVVARYERFGATFRRFFVSYGSATLAVMLVHWVAALAAGR